MSIARLMAIVPFVFATASCAEVFGEEPVFAFEFGVRVHSDDGRPIAGADIVASAGSARTGADGHATLVARGHEGDRLPYVVTCPREYQSPSSPLLVSLRRDVDPTKTPVYEVTCVPIQRTAVVAVRLDSGPHLPIVYLGQVVARTDASGAAHVLVSVAPGEPFRLTVDTSENEYLRPQYPSVELSVGESDDLLVFEQKMSVVEPKAPPPPKMRPRPSGPQRL